LSLSRSGMSPLEVATQAAHQAGKVLVDRFHSRKTIKQKSKGNLVTEVDTLSEELILRLLRDEYPDYNVLSEETNSLSTVKEYTWIVDPLDGTNNYVFGIPNFCINIALVNNDDVLMGITYDPIREECFHAEKGNGTYLNSSLVQVSQVGLLKDSLVGFDLGYSDEQGKKMLDIIDRLWGQVHCMRMMGSSALGLAYVACGRMTFYLHRQVYPWDIASGLLLVKEAGGIVTNWEGHQASFQDKKIIALNNKLYQQLIGYLD
jgi:myo-inositol-1(or 4)-monophosphatase